MSSSEMKFQVYREDNIVGKLQAPLLEMEFIAVTAFTVAGICADFVVLQQLGMPGDGSTL